ncbi:hypothetical protein MICAB_4150005 [Microcystis aeruginosa PCC 9717]|uniref:Uncharacterized protein n=1 Tax=Microcystis aeruginosa PCC 9717 TaxID=1160286 RepID=I4FQS4_MICAE|nr:hypothetical protein MICAB_4150005 [Microcystis aeruginosa PCC 9717]
MIVRSQESGVRRLFLVILPTPYTLHPTPHTLHPTPHTLHPTPHPPTSPLPQHPTPDKDDFSIRKYP